MIDLLVIHPGAQHGIYGALGDELTALEPPTIARMVLGYVLDRNFSGDILDAEAERLSPEEVTLRIEALAPRLVSIVVSGHQPSASTQQMVGASAIAKAIKARLPNQKIVMLGNHPSALPERTLREEAIDYVIDGEGPVTLVGILNLMRQHDYLHSGLLSHVPGLVWWEIFANERTGVVRRNPLAPSIDNLDRDFHGDVWGLLPMDRYRAHNWQCLDGSSRAPYASIYTSLNCPHACAFCMISVMFHDHKYRRFSPKSVVDRVVRLYAEYDVKTLKFADEMFILNRSHVTEICDGLIASGISNELNIWCYGRVDSIFPDLLDLMRRAGFRWIALGIESASPEIRDGAEKHLRRSDIVDVVRMIQAAGISVVGNFMFGLRDDTMETMRQTLDLALECLPEWANFYVCHSYPGSSLYDQAIREGWTLPKNFSGYSQHNEWCRPLNTKYVHARDVLRFRDKAFEEFFSNPAYQLMLFSKFGNNALSIIQDMLKYKLQRKLLTGEID